MNVKYLSAKRLACLGFSEKLTFVLRPGEWERNSYRSSFQGCKSGFQARTADAKALGRKELGLEGSGNQATNVAWWAAGWVIGVGVGAEGGGWASRVFRPRWGCRSSLYFLLASFCQQPSTNVFIWTVPPSGNTAPSFPVPPAEPSPQYPLQVLLSEPASHFFGIYELQHTLRCPFPPSQQPNY